jgi:hypothetical protein
VIVGHYRIGRTLNAACTEARGHTALRGSISGDGGGLDAGESLEPVHDPLIDIQKSVIVFLRKLVVEGGRLSGHMSSVEPQMFTAQVEKTLRQERCGGDQDERQRYLNWNKGAACKLSASS